MADGHYGGGRSISNGTPCKSGSVESKTAVTAKATEMKSKASASRSGASSGSPEESQKPLSESSESMSISSSSDASLSGSQANLPQGMETKECGGVDHETEERCRHGKRPSRLLCWDGSNTGRRYLAYPLNPTCVILSLGLMTSGHQCSSKSPQVSGKLLANSRNKLMICRLICWRQSRLGTMLLKKRKLF
ncbi:hypothetical protein GQ55_5G354100 [Panicum hallii var. hallii]|uniref:Uncharacterized protein n=1 Tax=Panicum hallii var. hallii TaxID=1504633 RepID=A0A2T7DME1_9POAL|nr:hypothetical protein GQ55_5G354100 [Panicum hallii var. hallii]